MPLIYVSDADLQRLDRLVSEKISGLHGNAHDAKVLARHYSGSGYSDRPDIQKSIVRKWWERSHNAIEKMNTWNSLQKNLKHHERSVCEYYCSKVK